MKLTNSDYKNILTFYKIDSAGLSNKTIKEKAEHFLAVKLCKCIKNVKASPYMKPNSEKRAIAICYNSVLKKKNLKIFNFKCKKTVKLLPRKGTRKLMVEKIN
jgi:hypothetical protein